MALSSVIRARCFLHSKMLSASKYYSQSYPQSESSLKPQSTPECNPDNEPYVDADSSTFNNTESDVSFSPSKEFVLDSNWTPWWKGGMRYHPGRCRVGIVRLPNNFVESANAYLKEFYNLEPQKKVFELCKKLCDVLQYRPLPVGLDKHSNKKSNKNWTLTKQDILNLNYEMTAEEKIDIEKKRFRMSLWRQIVYDRLNCVAYLIGRAPAAYAATVRVLIEIKRRDRIFRPKSMLDYGSGTGTAVWAANSVFGKDIEDFMCVDWSQCMNQTSQFLLSGGGDDAELSGIYIRPMLPLSYKHTYDIVVAAYTLSELPSEKERLTTLKILWEKTNKYLVIIEQGNRPGYHMIMEARNLIAHGIEGADLSKKRRSNSKINKGHIFAPCPHSKPCPKFQGNPCNFTQSYIPPLYAKKFHGKEGAVQETFTYIVLSKKKPQNPEWPRVITNPQGSLKKMWCHLCTHEGQIEHLYLNKDKYGSDIRRIVKNSVAGDRLPYQKPNKYNHNSIEDEGE
ncbi:ribosome assembly protein METTL17, mitochondrial-like [Styela clava]